LVPLPPLPDDYRIGKGINGRYSIYAVGIVLEVGGDTIRTISNTADETQVTGQPTSFQLMDVDPVT
jgi:hypothetical protein